MALAKEKPPAPAPTLTSPTEAANARPQAGLISDLVKDV